MSLVWHRNLPSAPQGQLSQAASERCLMKWPEVEPETGLPSYALNTSLQEESWKYLPSNRNFLPAPPPHKPTAYGP